MKPKLSMQLPPGLGAAFAPIQKYVKLAGRHFYFIFIMVVVGSLMISVYVVREAFNTSDEEYRQQKTAEFTRNFRLREDKETVDRVLQLGTADAGLIVPNYDPDRDNPFIE